MPIYEYVCRDCTNRFEDLVAAGTEISDCPACRSGDVAKIYSPFATHTTAPVSASACGQGACAPTGGGCCGGGCGGC